MAPSRLRRGLWLSLAFACAAQALSLDTFGGQAEAKLLMDRIVGKSDTQQHKMLLQANTDEENDYTCSKTKGCKLGCCGPL